MYMPVHVATAKVMYAQKQLQQSQISHIADIFKIKLTKNTCTYILMREKNDSISIERISESTCIFSLMYFIYFTNENGFFSRRFY